MAHQNFKSFSIKALYDQIEVHFRARVPLLSQRLLLHVLTDDFVDLFELVSN
jgi:hypothetical protein